MLTIIAGNDAREAQGFEVARFSVLRRTSQPVEFIPLLEGKLRHDGLYKRPHERRNGQLWDVISDAPMATDFACSRFLTPWLTKNDHALFMDFCDMLALDDIAKLFELADDRYAVQVVKREHIPEEGMKMDGQLQTIYARKNWSSVILFNLKHPANKHLTLDMVNTLPGRDLHRFCWLQDSEIGGLPPRWNHLVRVDQEPLEMPGLVHFTLGSPELLGDDGSVFGGLWLRELDIMRSANAYPPAAE